MGAKGAERATHPATQIAVIEGAETGPGAGKLVFENDRVRIWDLQLDPGERSALHTHLLDYVLVQIEGDEICNEPHPESQGFYNRRMVQEVHPGDTVFVKAGGTEVAANAGKQHWREICIELK
jgi:quercetin dioxygenase-like cupin family protein